MKDKTKKLSRPLITFQSGDDNEALVLAKLGMGNRCIKERTKLTDSQITYRLNKAKLVEGKKCGYRVAFRNGDSPLALAIIRDLHKVVEADIRRNVVEKIIHPVPEMVNIA